MFSIDGQFLANGLSAAMKVVGKAPESLTLASTKAARDKIILRGAHEGRFVTLVLDASVEKPFRIAVPAERLLALSQRRPLMQFNVDDRILQYEAKAGSYRGHIELLDATPLAFPKSPDDSTPLSEALRFALFELQAVVALTPQFVAREMMLFIEVLPDRVRAASGDDHHFGFVEAFRDKPDGAKRNEPQNFTFPFRYIPLIGGVFKKKSGDIRVASDASNLHVFDDDTKISLPLIDAGESAGPSMAGIVGMLQSLAEETPSAEFAADMDRFKVTLTSMTALRDRDKATELLLRCAGDRLTLKMQSTHGEVSDTIEIVPNGKDKKPSSIRLEPNMLADVLAKVEGECSVALYGKTKCVIERRSKKAKAQYLVLGMAGAE